METSFCRGAGDSRLLSCRKVGPGTATADCAAFNLYPLCLQVRAYRLRLAARTPTPSRVLLLGAPGLNIRTGVFASGSRRLIQALLPDPVTTTAILLPRSRLFLPRTYQEADSSS